MATDIGPRIGIDGEKEFRKNLQQISQQLKTLGTEMKAVTSAFDDNAKSQEGLAKQADVLNRQIDLQEGKIKEIRKALDYARQNYAENSNEVQRWQQALNNATTDLNKMRRQLENVEDEMSSAGSSSDDASDSIDDVGDAASKSSGKLDTMKIALGNLVADGIRTAIDGLKNLVSEIWNLDDATEDFRIAQGRVNTAFVNAGYSAEDAENAYSEFYKIIGDTDTAAEASQLLAQLAEDHEDLAQWIEISAGVAGTFGDSLPINSLIEAANETARTGTVTGVFADALNWAAQEGQTFGVAMRESTAENEAWNQSVAEAESAEDYFNLALQSCSTQAERNQLIMQTLSGMYEDAADSFYDSNEAVVEARETQNEFESSLANVGEAIGELKTDLAQEFMPVIESATGFIAEFIRGIDTEAIASAIKNAFSWLRENGQTLITIIGGMAAAFVALKGAVALGAAIKNLQDFSAGLGMVRGAWELLKTAISAANPFTLVITLITSVVGAVITLWNTSEEFRDFLTRVFDAAVEDVKQLWEDIKNVFGAVGEFFTGVWNTIKNIFSPVIEWFKTLFSSAWSAIEDAFASVKSFFSNIWKTIQGAFNSAVSWFKTLFDSAWSAIKNAFNSVGEFFAGVWDTITNAFGNAWDWAKGVGSDIINGIKDGISSAWNSVKNWFSNLWDGLFGGNTVTVNAQVNETRTVSTRSADGSHANGLDYVPFDGYIAELHKGEQVLTAGQAAAYRRGGYEAEISVVKRNISGSMASLVPDVSRSVPVSQAAPISIDIAGAVSRALSGAIVYMDGKKVGRLVTHSQNNDIRGAGLVATI